MCMLCVEVAKMNRVEVKNALRELVVPHISPDDHKIVLISRLLDRERDFYLEELDAGERPNNKA